MPVPWNRDDPRDLPLIGDNLRRVLRLIVEDAPLRRPPTVAMAQDWHRLTYQNVRVPVPYYVGGIRGADPDEPELYDYEVFVGSLPGFASRRVPFVLGQEDPHLTELGHPAPAVAACRCLGDRLEQGVEETKLFGVRLGRMDKAELLGRRKP